MEWTKTPGTSYDKKSSIGPLRVAHRNGHVTRRRNPDAYVRWNWGLDRIDQPEVTLDDTYVDGGATGNGTRVYLLDTGVAIGHHDFGGRALPGASVRCMTGEELDCPGESSEADVAAGIDWVIDHVQQHSDPRPSVISLSLGGAQDSDVLDNAVINARAAGILAVIDHVQQHSDPRPS